MSNHPKAYNDLPWNFEAFRSFINFEVIQQASSVLCSFEGKELFNSRRLVEEFQNLLTKRTGIDWIPDRNVSEDILFNVEGNVFRNKARVFTSFYLVDPECLKNREPLVLTPFCRALGYGYIGKFEFYKTIIARFSYPHPAYDENWKAWIGANIRLKPFIFILQILLSLHLKGHDNAYISINEFANFAHSNPLHSEIENIVKEILKQRSSGENIKRERSDKIERKIGDLFGFLCISGYTFYKKNDICLNMIDIHPKEKTYFFEKREGFDKYNSINKLITDTLEELNGQK
ncbi:MAG: hypothetical protein ACD_19C00264G0005 [uncultured bacterium]|nr:MAG: hypothetical protein ACD_19C00264G0005 [uncultured bacterium]